jgi:hypothetical protein
MSLMSYVLCLMSYVLCLMSYVLCLRAQRSPTAFVRAAQERRSA